MLLFIPIIALLLSFITFVFHGISPKTPWVNVLKSFFTWPPFTYKPRAVILDTETKILQDIKPYIFPPLRLQTSTKMTMGLKRLDESNWLTLDECYLPENEIRKNFLHTSRPNVLQCLPTSMSACYETLGLVSTFLSTRFPQHFSISSSAQGSRIHNYLTGESFPIGPKCEDPFAVAARLAMEDFNILMQNPETGDYHLQASATLFPAGWKLEERIGTCMANLHRPVPKWQEKLSGSVNKYFDHLNPRTSMERTNLFIQATPNLFQDGPEPSPSDLIVPEQLMVRRERQTFRRLEKSGAVLFAVRTYMQKMVDLGDDEVKALRSQVLGWDEEVRKYKGWAVWGETLMKWCEGKIGAVGKDKSEEK